MRLSTLELERIRRNRSFYEEAERLTGAPWRMLAAIHYLENSCNPASPGPGGPFQIDPPPDIARLERVLGRYSLPVRRVEEDFLTATVFAADFLQGKVRGRLRADTSDEALIKDAFWGYNGRVRDSADDSPYVANDPPARVLRVKGTVIGRDGQRIFVDRPFAKHGAIFIYRELLELLPRTGEPGPPAGERVVDAGQPGWEVNFRDQTRSLQRYQDERGRDFFFARSCAEGDTLQCDWRPVLPQRGRYRVEVFIPGVHATTRQALYFVKGVIGRRGSSEQMVTVNQLSFSDIWTRLDDFEFDPAVDESGVVRLTNFSAESPETEIAFDAVRWRLLV